MNVDKAKRNIRKVYNDIQTESAYGSTVSVSKMMALKLETAEFMSALF